MSKEEARSMGLAKWLPVRSSNKWRKGKEVFHKNFHININIIGESDMLEAEEMWEDFRGTKTRNIEELIARNEGSNQKNNPTFDYLDEGCNIPIPIMKTILFTFNIFDNVFPVWSLYCIDN